MYKEDLIDYLSGEISSSDLSSKIESEVVLFKKSLSKKGTSATVVYHGDNEKVNIERSHLEKIIRDFLNDNIDEYFISYIVDALLLSENTIFETEELKEEFEMLTDFEVNGYLTKEMILKKFRSA